MKKNLIDSDTFSLNLYKPPIYIQSLEVGAHGISSLLNSCTLLTIRVQRSYTFSTSWNSKLLNSLQLCWIEGHRMYILIVWASGLVTVTLYFHVQWIWKRSLTQESITKEKANSALASGLKNALVSSGCQQWCRSWQSTKHMSKISPMYKLLVSSRPPPSKADSQSPQK